MDGDADADAGCGNPVPAPNVNAGVVVGAGVVAPFVLNPLLPNPPPVPFVAPKLNGAGLEGVATAPNPFD